MSLTEVINEHVAALPPERQEEVFDFVLFLETRHAEGESDLEDDIELRRQRLTLALDALRESNVFSTISDPVAWQRSIRQDKPLYGREESE